jgi:hypothetical protein
MPSSIFVARTSACSLKDVKGTLLVPGNGFCGTVVRLVQDEKMDSSVEDFAFGWEVGA